MMTWGKNKLQTSRIPPFISAATLKKSLQLSKDSDFRLINSIFQCINSLTHPWLPSITCMFNLTGNPIGSTIKTYQEFNYFSSVQFSSVAQSCLTLCDPRNSRTPGLLSITNSWSPPKLYVHLVGDAIQLSHPLSSPSPPALNLSQHQGLFKWASSSHKVAKGLEFQLQHQSFQWTPRTDLF